MNNIKKKYTQIMDQVDHAKGRKEFVSLLKKATKLKAIFDEVKVL